jgi:hypothetical protein
VKKDLTFPLVVTLTLISLTPVLADYTLLLKNGRRITVQSYREEGSTIKFRGLGGEIGISKDQIQSIEGAREAEPSGLAPSESGGTAPASAAQQSPAEARVPAPQQPERQLSPEEERANEEKEYQQKLSEITRQLKEARERYSQSLRGSTGPDPSLLTTVEEIKTLNDDASSRRLDAQNKPVDPGVVRLMTPSPFSSLPPTSTDLSAPTPVGVPFYSLPPAYTARQKELSDQRNQAIQLEQDRQKLIDEMKQKNFSTGSLFLE